MGERVRMLAVACAAAAASVGFAAGAWAATERVAQVRAGDRFPAGTFSIFNPGDGPTTVDLSTVLGRKAIVLVYWIPGNPRADQVLNDVASLARRLDRSKIEVYGVVNVNPGLGVTHDVVRAKVTALGIDVPVLEDEDFVIGQRLGVRSVPCISLIDGQGVLRLSNGASLAQVLEYKLDLGAAIERLAAGGTLLTYGYLDPYFPVRELEGQPAPDFRAPLLDSNDEQSLSELIDAAKLNVMIFWSVNCPHCRVSLPVIDRWIKEHPEGINVFSCASASDATTRTKTKEFCEANGFEFPTLVDEDSRIGSLYRVTSTPTILIIGPDGVIDSTITSIHTDFGSMIERKKRELLKPSGS